MYHIINNSSIKTLVTDSFIRKADAMCNHFYPDCKKCPLSANHIHYDGTCQEYTSIFTIDAVKIVSKWFENHFENTCTNI